MKLRLTLVTLVLLAGSSALLAQTAKPYDLQQLLKENKFTLFPPRPFPITDNGKQGIAMSGVAWLKGVEFSTGTIELDLQGQDFFQKSFIGIAFHGVDSSTYDVIYFRPFNFQAEDPIRKIHAVQYMTLPDFSWDRLRNEHNGIYEKAVNPAPKATDWFHARIDVSKTDINVYVNNSPTPSLSVKKLNTHTTGKIGLWNEGLNGRFANLTIKEN